MFCKIQRLFFPLLLAIFLSSCTGISQPANKTPVSSILTSSSTPTIFNIGRSALSYGIFETQATSLTLEVSNTLSDAADISVEDGAGVITYEIQPGASTIVHPISSRGKRITITSGGQVKSDGEIQGTFIDKVVFDGPAIQIHASGKSLVIYGDSLAGGGNVTHPSAEAWPVLLRKYYPVTVNAYGYRSLYDDTAAPERRAEFISEIASQTPDYIWLAVGTNDYRFQPWSAQDFGEAYAALLDALHASIPRAILFAQSPIRRAREDPNSFGDSLEQYRQQVAAACLARPAWCVFADGTDSKFPQLNELDQDGVHLTKKSSTKYAEAVLQIIRK